MGQFLVACSGIEIKGNQLLKCKIIKGVCRKHFNKTPTRTKADSHRLPECHCLHQYSVLICIGPCFKMAAIGDCWWCTRAWLKALNAELR